MITPRSALLELLETRSFRRGTFTLASGKTSDFFIDCKRTVLHPEGHALVGHVLLDLLGEQTELEDLDAVAAVPLGGCPLAGSMALLSFQRGQPLPLLYVRTEKKDHGTEQRIEGAHGLEKGARVVLVEDVVTSGGSSLRAVEALRRGGLEVAALVVLVDRQEGGREAIEAARVPFYSVFTRADFIPPRP